jgi:hypothetical protein
MAVLIVGVPELAIKPPMLALTGLAMMVEPELSVTVAATVLLDPDIFAP